MKKFLSILLAVLMTISCFSFWAFAQEVQEQGNDNQEESELTNIAPNGMAYCTSLKNSDWTPPSSINNGKGYADDWHGWEPEYPSVPDGMNTKDGFSGEYVGIKFLNREYYEIHEFRFSASLHALLGGQNTHYTIEALVEGVWQKIGEFYDSDMTPKNYASYEDAMQNDTSNYHIHSDYTFVLDEPVTTNNVRIYISEFAKNYIGGDILVFPYIFEVEMIGKLGETPDIDLPEGAVFTQNATYNGLVFASSNAQRRYPFLAIDGKEETYWSPSSLEAGQYYSVSFEKEYEIEKFVCNFGTSSTAKNKDDVNFTIKAYVSGQWTEVVKGHTLQDGTYTTTYVLDNAVKTSKVMLVLDDKLNSAPSLYEFEAHIKPGERSYYNPDKFTFSQKDSAGKGNVAIYGEAYATDSYVPFSDVKYINDGLSTPADEALGIKGSYVWFPSTLAIPVSCGVRLDKEYDVRKIVVTCQDPTKIGTEITWYNIYAKDASGKETKIAENIRAYDASYERVEGYSYYTRVITFSTPVKASDIRIEFVRGACTIPNVMELEVYSDNGGESLSFDGYPSTTSEPNQVKKDVSVTTALSNFKVFAEPMEIVSSDVETLKDAIRVIGAVAIICLASCLN